MHTLKELAEKTDIVYSVIEIKEVNDEQRRFKGIATTPATDRMDDIVDPMGGVYKLPVSLLWQHIRMSPVGIVITAKPSKKGIEIEGHIPMIDKPAALSARLEEAWQSVKHLLVRGLSIGFRPLEYSFMDNGGIHFHKWEWLELSLVTIAANAEATITSIKSFDQQQRAALGKPVVAVSSKPSAGASAVKQKSINKPKSVEDNNMKTLAEQIAEFAETRKAKAAEMQTILQKSGDAGLTLDADESEQYDNLDAEVEAIDKHLQRLKKMQKTEMDSAKSVTDDPRGKKHNEVHKNTSAAIVKNVKNDEPGIGFARFAMAMYAGKGSVVSAKGFAETVFANDVRLQEVMKAAVAAGTTTSPTWAGNLVQYQNLSSEFVEFLRPRTIVGQFGAGSIPSLRRVPFKVRLPGKTSAGSASWVGEGYRKPVTASGYEAAELDFSKIAAISVITEELERFAEPSIQMLVRDDLAEAVIERADIDFVDPAKAAGTGATKSPASVTNGVTPIPSVQDPEIDINALWATADASNLPVGSAVYITNTAIARSLAGRKNPLGSKEYPDLTITGGFIDGVPVIVSNYVKSGVFVLAFASEIYLADDGMVNIDVSREATIFMDDQAATATPTAAQLVSMFQTNQLAIRAERYIHWKKRRPQAVAYLTGVSWGNSVES